jgi:thiol:disulfide interchange protein DsbD
MIELFHRWFGGAAAVVLSAMVWSAPAGAATPVPAHWTVENLPSHRLAPGATFTLALRAAIEPGWHIYAMEEPDGGPIATEIGLAAGDPVKLLTVDEPEPQPVADPATRQMDGEFSGNATFTLHLRLPSRALPKTTVLHVQARFQSCNDQVCLPPRTVVVAVPLGPMLR